MSPGSSAWIERQPPTRGELTGVYRDEETAGCRRFKSGPGRGDLMACWRGEEVAKYVEGEVKINPNGVDLRVGEVWKIKEDVEIEINGNVRKIEPKKEKVEPEGEFWILEKGVYEVRIANKVTIPKSAVGLLLPRSTFNRLGIIKSETALWDSGYSGYGTQTVIVMVKKAKIHVNELWFQLIFLDAKEVKEGYRGFYQNEQLEENRNH